MKAYPELIPSDKLDSWMQNQKNVLLVGETGVGKTAIIKNTAQRNNKKLCILYGSTCDPYLNFVGLPFLVGDDDNKELRFATPDEILNTQVLFIDELNRAPKTVRNGCMEIIQFRSINGKPLANLECVWSAINPDDIQDTYDVEPLDPAQIDRFHIHYKVPYKPCQRYFSAKFGEDVMNKAVRWWSDLKPEIQKIVTPRRLDFALTDFQNQEDIYDVLPPECNPAALLQVLSLPEVVATMTRLFTQQDSSGAKAFLAKDNTRDEALQLMVEKNGWLEFFAPCLSNEILAIELARQNPPFVNEVVAKINKYKNYTNLIDKFMKTHSNTPEAKFITDTWKIIVPHFDDQGKPIVHSNTEMFLGKINANAEYYENLQNSDKAQSFYDHIDNIIKAHDLNVPKDKLASWNKFITFVPKSENMTDVECQLAMNYLDALATTKTGRTGENFFDKFPHAMEVLNTFLRHMYYYQCVPVYELMDGHAPLNQWLSQMKAVPNHEVYAKYFAKIGD